MLILNTSFVEPSLDLVTELVRFGRSLRDRGILVGPGQLGRYCSAMALVDPRDLVDLYWAGRACLVSKRDDIAIYDDEFLRFFFRGEDHPVPDEHGPPDADRQDRQCPSDPPAGSSADREVDSKGDGDQESKGEQLGALASLMENLRFRSFATWTEEELRQLPKLMALILPKMPLRQMRRLAPALRGTRFDMRRTARQSMRHEGELLTRAWQDRRQRPRRFVLLIDVSGSMKSHSRAVLHFAYVLSQSELRPEVFCFGTRLTRVTGFLKDRNPNRAVDRASRAVTDWSGGTRIGESLSVFLRDWGRRAELRGSLFLVVSDGLECGDPDLLARQMERLRRLTHTIVWLNPLMGDPAYKPLARGMRAALPHVDRLVAADSVADLETVALLIPQLISPNKTYVT